MRIAFFTPVSPVPSGVCSVVESVLPLIAAKKDIELELFIEDGVVPTNPRIRSILWHPVSSYNDPDIRNSFDTAIYQMGNNYQFHREIAAAFLNYGGILELHDVALFNFMMGWAYDTKKWPEFIRLMCYCHGKKTENEARKIALGMDSPLKYKPMDYPMNRHFIDRADAIIVHSDYARQFVKGIRANVSTEVIPLSAKIAPMNRFQRREQARNKLSIGQECFVMGSFGYVTPAKRIDSTLYAIYDFKKEYSKPFRYFIVGPISNDFVNDLVEKLHLNQEVTITGEIADDLFYTYMDACDLCFNLRYPTKGESSASLTELLVRGIPCVVTNDGAFEEYPSETVFKISAGKNERQDLHSFIQLVSKEPSILRSMEFAALKFSNENLAPKSVAEKYGEFLSGFSAQGASFCIAPNISERMVDNICALGYTEAYVAHLARRLELFSGI